MATYPEKWGFLSSPEECIGKTLEKAELIKMEYGSVWDTAWAIRFTDGSRAFFVGGRGSGIMNPQIEAEPWWGRQGLYALETSEIFTVEELREMVSDAERRREQRRKEQEERLRREYERLKKHFGEG
jgi:hypothetical protein